VPATAENDRFLMSRISTTSANPVGQTVLGRLFSLRLPSPAVTVGLLIVCVFLLRLPSALVPREFNVDESQLLSEAMKFLVAPRPWMGIASCGPLNSYLLSIFLLMGFKAGYVLAHIVASLLVCLQVLVGYLTLRRLGSEMTAVVGGLLMVLLYGLSTRTDYLQYSTEWLSTLLLMLGFYVFLVWLDNEASVSRQGVQLLWLFVGGLALGAAPWAKLQAVPITGALGLLYLIAIFRARSCFITRLRRLKEVGAFVSGGVSTTCGILAIVAASGAMRDFWYSYVRAPLAFVGALSLATTLQNLFRLILTTPVHQLLLVALLGLALLDYASPGDKFRYFPKRNKWAYGGLVVYASAALFTACRSNNFFFHHAIFFIPPMSYLAAILAVSGANALVQRRHIESAKAGFVLALLSPVLLFVATMALYMAYTLRYIEKVKVVQQATSPMQREPKPAHLREIFSGLIGPMYWDLPDNGTEEIAAVVGDIRQKRPVRGLAVWGWSPGVYVLTGIPPATRDPTTVLAIESGPLKKYFQMRFVSDMQASLPDLFIDTVAKGAFLWPPWTENDGYESNAQLRKFIDQNYVLVHELTLQRGAKPVRFFARRQDDLLPK
jgi:hypothetical protein